MKNQRILFLFILFIGLSSCNKNLFDFSYKGTTNYKNFYLVDSITIDNPIIINSYKIGGRFVISKSLLSEFVNNKDFFQRPDVFLLGDNLYMDLVPSDYKIINYPDDGNCKIKRTLSAFKDVEIYEYEHRPSHFILGLVNVNYYNVKHNAENYYQICKKKPKISYYKIIYPLCK